MLVGVDIGGTFTDLVWWTGSELVSYKVSTTPDHPEDGLFTALRHVGADAPDVLLVHGSTIATNALLERKGARVVLLTTDGFTDVLEIARQSRIGIYDIRTVKPVPLVPMDRRIGVRERVDAAGDELTPLTEAELQRIADAVAASRPEAIAICLLHAYVNPSHERALQSTVQHLSPFVYRSSVVDPAYREYERMSTTVLNAYVAPLVARYVDRLRSELLTPLRLIGSHGGRQTSSALDRPANMILSGPAGGVVGAHAVARAAGVEDIITLDMGGTSTDIALIPGAPLVTRESLVEGLPLRAPMLDIYTIGAGGGSLARFDRGGALVVGPESAGAQPGPACYGRGGHAFTVTDAHVVLGHLLPDYFLGGHMPLDTAAAIAASTPAMTGHMERLEAFAEGVLAVANAAMERAVRTVSARRGYDPEQFTLFCFGGAGGLHAVPLARALGMRGVLVPRHAGILSALGMVLADTLSTAQESVLGDAAQLDDAHLRGRFARLETHCRDDILADGHSVGHLITERVLDMRYHGQSYELSIPWKDTLAATTHAFHHLHAQRFGYSDPSAPIDVVNASVTVRGPQSAFPLPEIPISAAAAPRQTVQAWFDGQAHNTAVYHMDDLARDQHITGPAILAGAYTTVLIPPSTDAHIDRFGNVHIPLAVTNETSTQRAQRFTEDTERADP